KDYGDELGYSLRYIKNNENSHYADIYVWGTPPQIANYTHREIVYAVTTAAVQDIHTIAEEGYYREIELLERLAYGEETILTMHKISMKKDNLAVLSFLYVSEYKGNLLKARISMPDNEFNRSREDIHAFVL